MSCIIARRHSCRVIPWIVPAFLAITGLLKTRAAPFTQPAPLTQPAASTQPVDLAPEVTAATRLMAAGDRSVAPTALLWLGSERDGIRVGLGSSRLRVAFHAARKFQLTAAVPWLVAIYDDPTAEPPARNAAAEAAIRLDPFYSRDLLDAVLDDQLVPPGSLESLSSAQCAAAAALGQLKDERALTMLVDAMTDYLDSLARGGPESGTGARSYSAAIAISRMDNVELLKRLRLLRSRYPRQPASGRLNGMLYQLETNHLSIERLQAMAAPDKEVFQRVVAVLALGNKAGADAMPFLAATERSAVVEMNKFAASTRPGADTQPEGATKPVAATEPVATTQPVREDEALAQDRTRPDTRPVVADTQPIAQTRPAKRSAREELLRRKELVQACRDAMTLIADRTPVRQAMPPLELMTRGSANPPAEVVPDDAELVLLYHLGTRTVGDARVHMAELSDPQGLLPGMPVVVRDEPFFQSLVHIPYADLARVVFSPDRTELTGLRVLDRGPGETAPDGFTCLGHTVVKEGKWENQALRLRRYGRETVALIPNRKRTDGTTAPDPTMWKVAEAVGPGDPIVARFEPGPGQTILQSLSPYRPALPATFVKLTAVHTPEGDKPAAELMVARRRMTCLLPEEQGDSSDPLSLDSQAWPTLPASAPLSVELEEGGNPRKLETARFDGGVALSQDRNRLAVRTGQAIYVARRERDWHGALEVGGARKIGTFFLAGGLQIVAAQDPAHPGVSSPEVGKLIALAGDHHAPSYAALDVAMPDLVTRWMAAEPAERPAIEREMHLCMCPAAIEAVAHEDAVYHEARRVLSPRQYRQALSQGQTTAIPTLQASIGKLSATTQKGAIQSATPQAGNRARHDR